MEIGHDRVSVIFVVLEVDIGDPDKGGRSDYGQATKTSPATAIER